MKYTSKSQPRTRIAMLEPLKKNTEIFEESGDPDEWIILIFQKHDEITVQLQSIIFRSILLVRQWNYIQSKAQKESFRLDTILSPFEQHRPKCDRLKLNHGIFQMLWNPNFIHRLVHSSALLTTWMNRRKSWVRGLPSDDYMIIAISRSKFHTFKKTNGKSTKNFLFYRFESKK